MITRFEFTLVFSASCFATAISLLIARGCAEKPNAEIAAKAAKLDEVCSLAKHSLRVDLELLRSVRDREMTLANFAGYHIGDGYQHLEWCVANAHAMVEAARACDRLYEDDRYTCASAVIDAMRRSIDAP